MQSILLTTPSKASKLEISHENKLSNGDKTIQGKQASEKKGTEFASVLDNTIEENKSQKANKAQNEVLSDSLQNKATQDKSPESKNTQSKEVDATDEEGKTIATQKGEDKELANKGTEASETSSKIKALPSEEKPTLDTDVATDKNKDINGAQTLVTKEQGLTKSLKSQTTINNNASQEVPDQLKETSIEAVKQQIPLASVTEEALTSSKSKANKAELNTPISPISESEASSTSLQENTAEATKALLEEGQPKLTTLDSEADSNSEKMAQVATETSTVSADKTSRDKIATQLDVDNIASQEVAQQQLSSAKELDQKESSVADKETNTEDSETLSDVTLSENKQEFQQAILGSDTKASVSTKVDEESNVESLIEKENASVSENQALPSQNASGVFENTSARQSDVKVSQQKEASLEPEALEAQELTTDLENTLKAETLAKQNNESPTILSEKNNPNKPIDDNEEADISAVLSENEDLQTQLETQTPEELISNLATSIETLPIENATQPQINMDETTEEEIDAVDESIESDVNIDELAVNPILAQIQTAQKMDTKVSDNQLQMAGVSGVDKDSKKSDKSSLKDLGKESIKLNKTNVENVLADASVESDLVEKQLISKANVANNEKLEGMLANFRAEANKPFFNQNSEGNAIGTSNIASANADKLLHQTQATNTQSVLQSSALQQPLELQAKHAANMVGERIMMMLNQGKQEVSIRLDPAELGSMHIKLHVQQDQLQMSIQTQVGQSRDIIEQNLPRLREQLAQQGINLGETSVQQQSQQSQSNSQGSSQASNSSRGSSNQGDTFAEDNADFIPTQIPLAAQGIDYYA